MAESSDAKKPGDLIRVIRREKGSAAIEGGWALIRFEPESGNAIAEKDGKRISSPRKEFEKLNFSGSNGLWEIIGEDPGDPDLEEAEKAWAALDLAGAKKALMRRVRGLDPGLSGVQTLSDFSAKVRAMRDSCLSSMELLRIEIKRAEAEYNRAPVGTAFLNDQKDTLLGRLRGLEDRYAARAHLRDKIMPILCAFSDALRGLEEAMRSDS